MSELGAQFADRGAGADKSILFGRRDVPKRQHSPDEVLKKIGVCRFCHKLGGAQGASVPRVLFVTLARKNDNPCVGGVRQNVGDQGKSFLRAVRQRRQTEIDQR